MVDINTVLAAINAAEALTPAFVQLVDEVKTLFGSSDQAAIEAALANLDQLADEAHERSQQVNDPT